MLVSGLVPAATAAPLAHPLTNAQPTTLGSPTYAPPTNVGVPLNQRFRGVNWERNGDNFTTGDLIQDGLSASDSYATTYMKSTQILTSLIDKLNINTVRLGLNEATVKDAWWTTGYAAVVQAATDLGLNVDLSFWSPSNASGFPGSVVPCTDGTYNVCYPVSDYAPWWAMWQKVIDTYGSYGNVYMQPYNEVAGYSDTATGYVGPTPTQLSDLDAAWLAQYPAFPRGRVIFGGIGDDYYLTIGNDHRLDGTLISYHPYCSFGLNFPTETTWLSWIKGQIAGMESRTIVTEFGLGQGSTNFDGPRDGNNCTSYVYAVTDYARQAHIGLLYWDYGSTDSWSVATRTGSGTAASPYAIVIRNQSFVDRLEWGYGFNYPLSPTIGSAASASFYTGAASNTFTVQTTGNPLASLTVSGPGPGGAMPVGVHLLDNGDGTATISSTPDIQAGTYGLRIVSLNNVGSAVQNFLLTVAAGSPPAPTTGVIAGLVTDAHGNPLANVCEHVFVASTLPPYRGNNYAPAIYQACSASDGTYSIPLVTAGSARYNVQFIDQSGTYLPQWYGDTGAITNSSVMGYNHPGTAITVTANATTTVNATMLPIPSGITVNPTNTGGTYALSGTITVTNNNNVALTGVNVTDAVNDPNGTCVVTGGTGVTIAASPLYPGALVKATFPYTCTYSAAPASMTETNTATATWDANNHVPNAFYQYTQSFTFPAGPGLVAQGTLLSARLSGAAPNVAPNDVGPASTLTVSGLTSPRSAAVAGTITVTALDASNNVATGYTGTVKFTTTDTLPALPANYTFTAGDAGVHTFNVTLNSAGTRTVTATDTVTATINGVQSAIVVTPAAATTLTISGLTTPRAAGAAGTVTVTAQDPWGNVATGYTGTVHLTSSDPASVLPADYTFVAGDAGVHAFTSAVTLNTVGTQSVTATDTVTGTINGTQSGVVVSLAATHYTVSGLASPRPAGTVGLVTVTALDSLGNVATGYLGTVHFTSSDPQGALPANYTFNAVDAGVRTFGVTLDTAGTQSVTATDTVTGSITGAESGIVVNAGAPMLTVSGVTTPQAAGTVSTITVVAASTDTWGNPAVGGGSGYLGTIHFTSSDPQAVLPADYTFTAGDAGTHTFTSAVTLKTSGIQSVSATDTVTPFTAGAQSGIVVTPLTAVTLLASGLTTPRTAGATTGTLTVAAKDIYGNTATGYTGTIHFTSSDPQAVLPPDYTFLAANNGTHGFTGTTVNLRTVGTQSVTATDTVTPSITGTQSGIVVNPSTARTLTVTMASPQIAGVAGTATVTAKDLYGNTATGYTGTVHFTSSDPAAVLPANYTFLAADAGGRAFSVTLNTAGTQSVTATDTVTSTITGAQSGVVVLYTISGTFTAGGTPQAGGTVYVFDAATSTYLGSAAVDGSGNYSFNVAPGSYKLYLAPVTAGYGLQWYGGGTNWAGATTVAVSGNTTVNIALTPAAYTLSGTFTAGGTPQTGGTVYAFSASSYTYIGSSAVDGSGNYSFNLAPGSYKLYLAPVTAGYGLQWFGGVDFASATTVAVSSNTTQNIALAALYTISGTFTAGGTPQTGGSVYAFDSTGNYVGSSAVDSSGNYFFSNLAAGSYKLYLSPVTAGYGLQWFGGADFASATAVAVSSNTTQNVALAALPATYTLSGTFLANLIRQTGGTVYVFNAATSSYVGSATVDGAGHYSFANLAPGSYKLYLAPVTAGYGLQWFGGVDWTSATVIGLSANTTVNIVI